MKRKANLVARAVLDPDWRSNESEGVTYLIFKEALVGEVQLHLAIGEDHERRRCDCRLRHVIDLHLLPRWNGGTFKIHVLEKAVHLAGSDATAALYGNFFQRRKYLLRALSG